MDLDWLDDLLSGAGSIYGMWQSYNMGEKAGDYYDQAGKMAALQSMIEAEKWQRYKDMYTPLEQARIDSELGLLPLKTDYAKQMLGEQVKDLDLYGQYRNIDEQFLKESQEGLDLNQEMGRAQADVAQSFKGAVSNMLRDSARMGVNPNSGKFASSMGQLARDKALATAGARTNAYSQGRDTNYNRLGNAVNIRKGLAPANTNFNAANPYSAAQGGNFGGVSGAFSNLGNSYWGMGSDMAEGAFGLLRNFWGSK